MIIQHPVISGTDTSTCQPSFISVFFQPGEYTERQFFPSDIELCPIEVSTPEKAVKLLASPVFIFWLYQQIAVHIFLFPFPWSQTAGQFNCTFMLLSVSDSGANQLIRIGIRVRNISLCLFVKDVYYFQKIHSDCKKLLRNLLS